MRRALFPVLALATGLALSGCPRRTPALDAPAGGSTPTAETPPSPTTASATSLDRPVRPPADHVVAAAGITCALRGSLTWCWGSGAATLLGVDDARVPVQVEGGHDGVQLAVGASHACLVRRDETVACWGEGGDGQLGDGAQTSSARLVPVTGLADVVEVAVGEAHSCALRSDNTVACWGAGRSGQLADPDLLPWNAATPGEEGGAELHGTAFEVPELTDAVQIAAGTRHTCALRADGHVACWGDGSKGATGRSDGAASARPTEVPGIEDAVLVVAAGQATCALDTDGTVQCWGRFQAPDGTVGEAAPTPRVVVQGARQIAVGASGVCAALSTGVVFCESSDPALLAHAMDNPSPSAEITGIARPTWLAVGQRHACTRHIDGGVSCWGDARSLGADEDGIQPPTAVSFP